MIKPSEMSRVIITGPKSVQEDVIEELHKLKVLHVIDYVKNEYADIGEPLESASLYSKNILRIRALISILKLEKQEAKEMARLGNIELISEKINDQVNVLNEELKSIDSTLSKSTITEKELELLKKINIPLENLSGYKTLASFSGFVKDHESLDRIKNSFPKNKSLFLVDDSRKIFVLAFVESKEKDKALDILNKNNFQQVNFTGSLGLKGTPQKNLQNIKKESEKLLKRKDEISKELYKISTENKDFLLNAEKHLTEELEKAEAPLKFASTKSSFQAIGWIPMDELTSTIEKLEKAGQKKIDINFDKPKKHDDVPVKLKNPKIIKPFELLIDLYSYPAYKEFDPAFLLFLTFPIFFGAMLGDVGYGAVTLLLALIFRWTMPKSKAFMNIMIISAITSIIFGFVFGEIFGFIFIEHPIVHRSAENPLFMPLAIIVGVIHVNLGLVLGFLNERRSHGFMHAVYAKLSWIVLEVGIALSALSVLKMIDLHLAIGAGVVVIAVLMLLKGEGIRGAIEIPGLFTNILSYLRLMAIGLSSVILAEIVNESSLEMTHQGGIMLFFGILLMIVGHTINIMLGLLGSFLHSLRLHYVEFFSKFFHGGAKKYQPFGSRD